MLLKSKIPTTVITGFLGAGKSTMIRHIMQGAKGKRIALIINEFGDLGVDGGLFKGCGIENCRDDDIIELNNGCICCTVADDFIPAITKLLACEPRPDHIVIETSGLALPQPLVAAFNWPDICTELTVDGVVTVIDAPAVYEGRFADDPARVEAQRHQDEMLDHDTPLQELFEDQIRAADLIVLNKTDLLTSQELDQVRGRVEAECDARRVPLIPAHFGQIGIDVLLGLGVGSEADIKNRQSHHELHHEEGEEHSHDDFTSFVVATQAVHDVKQFSTQLEQLIKQYGILRLKGFCNVADKAMRLVVQAVGSRLDCYFDRPWGKGEDRASQLVVIGLAGLDEAEIRTQLQNIVSAREKPDRV